MAEKSQTSGHHIAWEFQCATQYIWAHSQSSAWQKLAPPRRSLAYETSRTPARSGRDAAVAMATAVFWLQLGEVVGKIQPAFSLYLAQLPFLQQSQFHATFIP